MSISIKQKILIDSHGNEINRPPNPMLDLSDEELKIIKEYDLSQIPKAVKKAICLEFLNKAYDEHGIYLSRLEPANYKTINIDFKPTKVERSGLNLK